MEFGAASAAGEYKGDEHDMPPPPEDPQQTAFVKQGELMCFLFLGLVYSTQSFECRSRRNSLVTFAEDASKALMKLLSEAGLAKDGAMVIRDMQRWPEWQTVSLQPALAEIEHVRDRVKLLTSAYFSQYITNGTVGQHREEVTIVHRTVLEIIDVAYNHAKEEIESPEIRTKRFLGIGERSKKGSLFLPHVKSALERCCNAPRLLLFNKQSTKEGCYRNIPFSLRSMVLEVMKEASDARVLMPVVTGELPRGVVQRQGEVPEAPQPILEQFLIWHRSYLIAKGLTKFDKEMRVALINEMDNLNDSVKEEVQRICQFHGFDTSRGIGFPIDWSATVTEKLQVSVPKAKKSKSKNSSELTDYMKDLFGDDDEMAGMEAAMEQERIAEEERYIQEMESFVDLEESLASLERPQGIKAELPPIKSDIVASALDTFLTVKVCEIMQTMQGAGQSPEVRAVTASVMMVPDLSFPPGRGMARVNMDGGIQKCYTDNKDFYDYINRAFIQTLQQRPAEFLAEMTTTVCRYIAVPSMMRDARRVVDMDVIKARRERLTDYRKDVREAAAASTQPLAPHGVNEEEEQFFRAFSQAIRKNGSKKKGAQRRRKDPSFIRLHFSRIIDEGADVDEDRQDEMANDVVGRVLEESAGSELSVMERSIMLQNASIRFGLDADVRKRQRQAQEDAFLAASMASRTSGLSVGSDGAAPLVPERVTVFGSAFGVMGGAPSTVSASARARSIRHSMDMPAMASGLPSIGSSASSARSAVSDSEPEL